MYITPQIPQGYVSEHALYVKELALSDLIKKETTVGAEAAKLSLYYQRAELYDTQKKYKKALADIKKVWGKESN